MKSIVPDLSEKIMACMFISLACQNVGLCVGSQISVCSFFEFGPSKILLFGKKLTHLLDVSDQVNHHISMHRRRNRGGQVEPGPHNNLEGGATYPMPPQ